MVRITFTILDLNFFFNKKLFRSFLVSFILATGQNWGSFEGSHQEIITKKILKLLFELLYSRKF